MYHSPLFSPPFIFSLMFHNEYCPNTPLTLSMPGMGGGGGEELSWLLLH